MVSKKYIKLLTLLIFIMGSSPLIWAGGNGTSNAEFLRIGAGAAPSAMGGAYTAIATDVNATFWNPAGLAQIKGRELSFMHLSWFESLNYEYLAYAQRLSKRGGIGAHLIYFWVPDFNSTMDETGTIHDTEDGKMADLAVAVSYGYDLGYSNFMRGYTSTGVTIKVLSRTLMDENKMNYAMDAGLMVKSNMGVTFAFTMMNLGTAIDEDQTPLTFKLGVGYPIPFEDENNYLRVACDVVKPVDLANLYDDRYEVAVGVEYTAFKMVTARVGYYNDQDLAGFSAGVGGRYKFLKLDYAFAPYGELGYTHRFSLSFDFPSEKYPQDKKVENENSPTHFNVNF